MTAPEDRYCSSCGFGDYCMRERSCYRRDQGEIRSVEERGEPDPAHDEPLQPHWSESPFWRGVFAREAAAAEACDPEPTTDFDAMTSDPDFIAAFHAGRRVVADAFGLDLACGPDSTVEVTFDISGDEMTVISARELDRDVRAFLPASFDFAQDEGCSPEQHSGLASAPAAHEACSGLRAQANTSEAKAQPPRRLPGCAASAPPKGGKSHNA